MPAPGVLGRIDSPVSSTFSLEASGGGLSRAAELVTTAAGHWRMDQPEQPSASLAFRHISYISQTQLQRPTLKRIT